MTLNTVFLIKIRTVVITFTSLYTTNLITDSKNGKYVLVEA